MNVNASNFDQSNSRQYQQQQSAGPYSPRHVQHRHHHHQASAQVSPSAGMYHSPRGGMSYYDTNPAYHQQQQMLSQQHYGMVGAEYSPQQHHHHHHHGLQHSPANLYTPQLNNPYANSPRGRGGALAGQHHHSWNERSVEYMDQQHNLGHQHSVHHQYDPSAGMVPGHHHQHHQQVEAIPGTFYPTSSFAAQLHGAPISAIAHDDTTEPKTILVASHTQYMDSSGDRRPTHRASLLVTHTKNDGMLYSSVAAHPEASSSVLSILAQLIYGGSGGNGANQTSNRIPPHAYIPPYGSAAAMTSSGFPATVQMGISKLIPFSFSNRGSHVISVSPSAVRVHKHGGLQVSDYDIEGMLCGTPHPYVGEGMTHVTVGGIAYTNPTKSQQLPKRQIHCMDIEKGLRVVSSHEIKSDSSSGGSNKIGIGVTVLGTNHDKQNIVAGCSDGTIRLLDGSWRTRGGSDLAILKSHYGGITDIDVSDDGNLICTAGYSARPSNSSSGGTPYAFPDQFVYIYDTRMLGRGGVAHQFRSLGGAPRFVRFLRKDLNAFLDSAANNNTLNKNSVSDSNRILACSGRTDGGLQIITPFNTSENIGEHDQLFPPTLESGEFVTCMDITDDGEIALGTNRSNVLQYKISGYDTVIPAHRQKQGLAMPPLEPEPPALSIDPSFLNGGSASSFFGSYTLHHNPTLSSLNPPMKGNTFGQLATKVMLATPRRVVKENVTAAISHREVGSNAAVIPTSKLNLDLLGSTSSRPIKKPTLPNPNKLVYSEIHSSVCYQVSGKNVSNWGKRRPGETLNLYDTMSTGDNDDDGQMIPARYRCTIRPTHVGASSFHYANYNDTGMWPGWEYPLSLPNAYASPVLLLLYFVPEIRSSILNIQYDPRLFAVNSTLNSALSPELGFLFHQIESISQHAMSHPVDSSRQETLLKPNLRTFLPHNFITSFAVMPEAEALALIDGAPAAVGLPRRPEAFYKFLLHHLDKELSSSTTTKQAKTKAIDSLYGFGFMSINEFITGSGPPVISSTKNFTVEMAYDPYVDSSSKKKNPSFGEVLRFSLCKEIRLRAWCKETKSYETVVQRKIATSLPKILSLSTSCAGQKGDNGNGLSVWRSTSNSGKSNNHWLPEMIEVELEDTGNVIVRELHESDTGDKKWITYKGDKALPKSISKIVTESINPDDDNGSSQKQKKKKQQQNPSGQTRKFRYRLDAVLSFVREDVDSSDGHHVLHVRVPKSYKQRALSRQCHELRKLVSAKEKKELAAGNDLSREEEMTVNYDEWTLTGKTNAETFRKRLEHVKGRLDSLDTSSPTTTGKATPTATESASLSNRNDDWIIANGYVVSETVIEDARAFHVPFKDPCLVIFRAVDDGNENAKDSTKIYKSEEEEFKKGRIPFSVMQTRSISTARPPQLGINKDEDLPGLGDPIAFDAEFVSVQEEDSTITDTGSKITIREQRSAIARTSVIDCSPTTATFCKSNQGTTTTIDSSNNRVIIDDYVLPKEPVKDYLTRWSGIVPNDLHPKNSPHHLISLRRAYLKLRYLQKRGCIFVGHGLSQDFSLLNLFVPPHQIIDTVEIFHKSKMRYISLRFLAHYFFSAEDDTNDNLDKNDFPLIGETTTSNNSSSNNNNNNNNNSSNKRKTMSVLSKSKKVFQQDTHDSIDDAAMSFEIFLKAIELKHMGKFEQTLDDIYDHGTKTDWKLA